MIVSTDAGFPVSTKVKKTQSTRSRRSRYRLKSRLHLWMNGKPKTQPFFWTSGVGESRHSTMRVSCTRETEKCLGIWDRTTKFVVKTVWHGQKHPVCCFQSHARLPAGVIRPASMVALIGMALSLLTEGSQWDYWVVTLDLGCFTFCIIGAMRSDSK
jgi:hypothetical protein